jgi:hypothetical protein
MLHWNWHGTAQQRRFNVPHWRNELIIDVARWLAGWRRCLGFVALNKIKISVACPAPSNCCM